MAAKDAKERQKGREEEPLLSVAPDVARIRRARPPGRAKRRIAPAAAAWLGG